VVRGELGNAQLVVRPHPMFEYRGLVELFGRFPRERVIVQQTRAGPPLITSNSVTSGSGSIPSGTRTSL
jgi:hypothetical protein